MMYCSEYGEEMVQVLENNLFDLVAVVVDSAADFVAQEMFQLRQLGELGVIVGNLQNRQQH